MPIHARVIALALLLICPWNLCAAELDVCSACTYTTIGAAVSAASNGDTIRVAAGTYNEAVALNSNKSLSFKGGWNSTFTTQNRSLYQSIVTAFDIGTSNAGEIDIEGLYITGSSTHGLYMNSPNTDLLVYECVIHSNGGDGISIYSGKVVMIGDNEIYSNCTSSGYGGIVIGVTVPTEQSIIHYNTIHSHSCEYGAGIMLGNATHYDVIDFNTIYGNRYGINLMPMVTTSEPYVGDNEAYSNTEAGIHIQGGSAYVTSNRAYRNSIGIKQIGALNTYLINNVVTQNSFSGIHFVGGSASNSSVVTNNIAYANDQYGIYFSNNSNGTGTSSFFPSSFKYNLFYTNPYAHLLHTGHSPNSFNSEEPGAFGDINLLSGADYNMIFDPHFVDPDAYDYHLSPTSFAIDHGDPQDPYFLEPAPNGSRINLGVFGFSSDAETSPANLTLSNVSAQQNGNDLEVSFDTSTSVELAWIAFEYWNGSSYQSLATQSLAGSGAEKGYNGYRIQTGANRSLTIGGINSIFDNTLINAAKLRVTLSYGNRSISAESGAFVINYLHPTATPTPSNTPTATPSPTPTAPSGGDQAQDIVVLQFKARSSVGELRRASNLRFKVSSTSTENVQIAITIRRSGRVIDSMTTMVTPHATKILNVNWRGGRKAGRYSFCVTAEESNNIEANRSCAQLVVK